jgi:flagellar hook-basal body complex protein FliE
MALDIASLGSTLSQGMAPNVASQISALARTNAMHYTADGSTDGQSMDELGGLTADSFSVAGLGRAAKTGSSAATEAPSFEKALLKAMDGVSSSQNKSDDILQRMVADPNSVDAQDVTIAMAEANMSLNLAKTILSRVVTAWKDVINTR